jgi:adenine-specific DNA-methyltransferase
MNLNLFNTTNLFEASTHLFKQLGITLNSNTTEPLPLKDVLKHYYKDNDTFKSVDKTYFIGIIDDSVFKVTGMFDKNYSYKEAIEQGEKNYNGLMLFALELNRQPTRTEISELTRAFNRISQKMPVALLLKYIVDKQAVFSIAISERFRYLQNWREGEKVGKIIMLRDIYTQNPHTGHIRILQDLVKPAGVNTYAQLHQHWLQVLDVNILNKKFFQELSNWYFSAINKISFPDDVEKNAEIRNATNLIRLITRVIFVWFLKEKHLVPASLFRKDFIANLLKDFNKNPQSHNYYNAILQNLFFGTLNQKIEERKFVREGDFQTNREEYGVKNLFRYADLFTRSEQEIIQLFKDIPFLNGGLFDCLDKLNDEGKTEYVDGFSRNPKKKAIVPDYTFFGKEQEVDLNEVYGTKNKRYTFRGLINILESYKFTVAENTPLEEEIALDPELLGKVFENLLASYNPETQTTARKETGSFYTPREIVNYMVEESLLEYLKQNVKNTCENFETRLRELISYTETPNLFNREETQAIIEAINNCKILDPACGSGAFPMGILHTMVHILQKLDPENQYWKELQRKKAIQETEQAFTIGDKEERAKRLAEINDVFENNASDYGRKLYLIENCIYGIDIQPIAIQIAKLRFFISLVIDQKVNKSKENFGIRSLPNLETKFVAANTLIGLDKPQQLAIRNPKIDEKENELKNLRHEYFTANTRRKKLALQSKDKNLRIEIAELLKADGWQSKVAEQIASFDPYDQNHFANWFDPEWMFGLKEGFDIVIGNPPYVVYSLTSEDKNYYVKNYKSLKIKTHNVKNQFNVSCLFIEKGFELLKEKSVFSMIIPFSISRVQGYQYIREFINNNCEVFHLVDEYSQFENVTLEMFTLFYKKIRPTHNYPIKVYSRRLKSYHYFNRHVYEQEKYYLFYYDDLYEKIKSKGIRALNGYRGIDTNDFSYEKNNNYDCVYLEGKNISKYEIKKVKNQRFINHSYNKKLKLKESEIVLTQFGTLPRGTVIETKFYCPSCGNIVVTYDDKLFSQKYILSIINSKLVSYYFHKYILNYANLTIHLDGYYLEKIPIPAVNSSNKSIVEQIEMLVEQILALKEQGKDTTALEAQIDLLVYKLYDLTYEEVKVIDPAFALSREEYESKALE